MFRKNVKGIGAIISLSLLIVVSLIGYFIVHNDILFVTNSLEVSLQNTQDSSSIEISKIDNDSLFVMNYGSDVVLLNSVKIGNATCSISIPTTLYVGLTEVDIGNCTLGFSDLDVKNVMLLTELGIVEESELLRTVPKIPDLGG